MEHTTTASSRAKASLPIAGLFALTVAGFLTFTFRLVQNRRRFRNLPGPPHSFLWGHLQVMGEASASLPPNCHPQLYLTSIVRKYDLKGIFYLDLWPFSDSMVCFTTPELMGEALVTKALPMHKISDDHLSLIVGRNAVAAANGPLWKNAAHSMSPAFSLSHIRSLTDLFVDETLLLRDTLGSLAKTGEVFSIEEKFSALIFDVIARIVFNFPLHAQTKGSRYLDDFHKMIQLLEAQFSWNPFVKIRTFLSRQMTMGRTNSYVRTQIKSRFDLLRDEKIVPSRREPLSILDLMLREQVKPTSDGHLPDIPSSDMELLVTNVKALLLGGYGTTTDTICYLLMLLSTHPAIVQKLREEHARVFASSFSESISILRDNPQKLVEMEYTAAVIKETLRLFPVGFGPRAGASEDATITYNGAKYPIGHDMMVLSVAHIVHYDPEYYSDPTSFRPERWIETPSNTPPHRSRFLTFGRGPRACMGQNLAADELKVFLLMIVRDFDFKMDQSSKWQKPNKEPKANYTTLDTVYGDVVFQELALEARPRGNMMMSVRKVGDEG